MRFAIGLIALVAVGILAGFPRHSSAPLSSGCDYLTGDGAIELRCDIYSTNPSLDDMTIDTIGVSVYGFFAPTWSAYPSGWINTSVYCIAKQAGMGECAAGYYGAVDVEFRYKPDGGSQTSLGAPATYGPEYLGC